MMMQAHVSLLEGRLNSLMSAWKQNCNLGQNGCCNFWLHHVIFLLHWNAGNMRFVADGCQAHHHNSKLYVRTELTNAIRLEQERLQTDTVLTLVAAPLNLCGWIHSHGVRLACMCWKERVNKFKLCSMTLVFRLGVWQICSHEDI